MNCIVVDDEPLAREGMELLIPDVPFLNHLGSFSSGMQALDFISKNEVDLVFLDIEMPGISGLDLIKTLPFKPFIVLTTAYSQYALEAFELHVSDYLVKPIKQDRFLKSVYKVKEIFDLKNAGVYKVEQTEQDYIFIRHERKFIKLFHFEILYINGLKDYVMIHTQDKKYVTAMNLKTTLSQLPDDIFIRTSKSYAINKNYIKSIDIDFIDLGGVEIPLGNSYKDSFKKAIVNDKLIDRKK